MGFRETFAAFCFQLLVEQIILNCGVAKVTHATKSVLVKGCAKSYPLLAGHD